MSRYFALLSIVFMMGFVVVFDKAHLEGCNARFWKTSSDEPPRGGSTTHDSVGLPGRLAPLEAPRTTASSVEQAGQRRGQLRKAEAESGGLGRARRYPLAVEQQVRHFAKQQPQRESRDREHRGPP